MKYNGKEHDLQSRINERRNEREGRAQMPQNIKQLKMKCLKSKFTIHKTFWLHTYISMKMNLLKL